MATTNFADLVKEYGSVSAALEATGHEKNESGGWSKTSGGTSGGTTAVSASGGSSGSKNTITAAGSSGGGSGGSGGSRTIVSAGSASSGSSGGSSGIYGVTNLGRNTNTVQVKGQGTQSVYGPDLSRRPDLKNSYAISNGYTVFYDDNGYATRHVKGAVDYAPHQDYYVANGTYGGGHLWTDEELLSPSDLARVRAIRSQLSAGQISGDQANADANQIRSGYGYTIDQAGNVTDLGALSAVEARRRELGLPTSGTSSYQQNFLNLMFPDSQSGDLLGDYYNLATGQMTSAQRAAMEAMYAPQVSYMPSYDYSSSFGGTGGDLTAYLKELYAQQMAAELASLNASYQTSEAELAAQDDLIRDLHNQARNQAAAQNELERMRMNEYYLMQGLNTGAAGQLALAQSAAYQGNLAGIGSQEAQALADNALALAQLRIQYETAIQQAQAQGNMQLANALYNEMVRQENVALQQQAMAQEQARWEAQFAYQQQQDALAQQNYLNELYAAQMAPSEPLLTYSQMMDALAGGLVTPSVTQAYEYYMGTPYNGSVQTTLNKSKSSGSSGGGSKSNMTLTTAKAMASAGQFTDDVISTLKSAGFNDGYLASEYGYSPSGSGMNESNFNAAMTTISAMINQGNTAQAEASIGQIWERLSDTQKGQVQKMVGAYGGSVSA